MSSTQICLDCALRDEPVLGLSELPGAQLPFSSELNPGDRYFRNLVHPIAPVCMCVLGPPILLFVFPQGELKLTELGSVGMRPVILELKISSGLRGRAF